MRAGIVGAVLVGLAGAGAGAMVFLRDGAMLQQAGEARDAGLAALAAGDLAGARDKMRAAADAAAQVGASTGRLAAAQAVGTEALRWSILLQALQNAPARPGDALAALDADGAKVLGKELPAALVADLGRVRAERLLEAGLALERNQGLDQAPRLLEAALPVLEAQSSTRLEEARAALERARLRRALRDGEGALRAGTLEEAGRLAGEVAPGLAAEPGPGFAADERTALRERLTRLQQEQADRAALAALDAALAALAERVTTNDLGRLLPEVEATALPELRGGYPAEGETRAARAKLEARRGKLLAVAREFQGMVLAAREAGKLVFVDRTEVTHGAFLEFVRAKGYEDKAHWSAEGFALRTRLRDTTRQLAPAGWKNAAPPEGKADHPVTGVGFHEAEAYAKWRGKRLPTLAEWQAAATPASGQPWPWGAEWRTGAGNVRGEGPGTTEPVGKHADGAGPTGAVDLFGNASEIVRKDAEWVAAGGSYESLPRQATAVATRPIPSSLRAPDTGFRCAKELPLPWEG
jgi:hypothetical protein